EDSHTTNHSPLNSPSILKPYPLHPPHAFTDPLPLSPRRRRKLSQPKQPPQLPQALVMSEKVNMQGPNPDSASRNESNQSPESISGTIAEDGVWNLPDSFIAIYVCAWDARERPLFTKHWYVIFISQKVRHDWNMLLFPPSSRSLHSSYSGPGYPIPLPPTPPVFAKPLPLHQRHSSHSAHLYPSPLPNEVFPLELYLSDIFSATRHHPRLDAMMLTARSKQDAEDLIRASRVIGRDLTGMELLRPPVWSDVDEALSSHESEDLLSKDYVRLSRLESVVSALSSLPAASRENLLGETSENANEPVETPVLDVSEVDIARIVPRVISHRVRMRNGPEDEVLASALYGATFKPKVPQDAMSELDQVAANKLQSVKAVLVDILSEV
ncbi:hypothetical protein CPB84DRAFT_1782817, partial [Gymnopilus junonius]